MWTPPSAQILSFQSTPDPKQYTQEEYETFMNQATTIINHIQSHRLHLRALPKSSPRR
ncbi:predicted protein [Botrytis cinerea T4]|uniref:Uncharacterized protein n=1 Tax=Botryotinia fuckeliana (strain T4) TaxID=999810 RepID=G2YRL1_BOTF4|nr:predicted protein [Botrytis cinerea T4]